MLHEQLSISNYQQLDCLFNSLLRPKKKNNIKAPHYWPFVRGIHHQYCQKHFHVIMMTSSNGNIFRVIGYCAGYSPASGEFPAQRPVMRSFDVFCDLCLNKRLRKQSWGWWFKTLSCPLWRHCNVMPPCSSFFLQSANISCLSHEMSTNFCRAVLYVVVIYSDLVDLYHTFMNILQGYTTILCILIRWQWSNHMISPVPVKQYS